MQDVQVALSSLGPRLTSEIAALLVDFRRLVAEIPNAFDDVGDVMALKLATESMLEQLKTNEAVAAAWRDVVSTFKDPEKSTEDRELRVMQLAELAEFRGVDYEAWATQAQWILMDNPEVLADLGAVDRDELADDQVLAGVDELRRLQLCGEELARVPRQSEVVVWLALADAPLHADCIVNGPIQICAVRSFAERLLKTQPGPRTTSPSWFHPNLRLTAACWSH